MTGSSEQAPIVEWWMTKDYDMEYSNLQNINFVRFAKFYRFIYLHQVQDITSNSSLVLFSNCEI